MSYITPLGKVRGTGSAREGAHHWWLQRFTALALIPLSLWFLDSLLELTRGGERSLEHWLASPYAAIALGLLVVAGFAHAYLGSKVVLEDYVHCHAKQVVSILAVRALATLGAAASVLAIVKLHFSA
jgi:succinate dehydrogenase / fumarate reductase membrane anchor subunit